MLSLDFRAANKGWFWGIFLWG